jgi:DNA-binding MarR family transcriptional regulator
VSKAAAPKPKAAPALRLDDYLPYRLSVAANEVSRLVARAYEDRFGITSPQWRILANLAEHGPSTPLEIGRYTVMDKVTVSRAAQGLLQRGLLERRANGADGRSHILAMSAAGVALYDEVAPLAAEFERALLDQWSPEDVERLHAQLRLIERTAARLASER